MDQNCLPKIKRVFGEESQEYKYVQRVRNYCAQEGVVRMEQELKSEYLQREALCYWGLFDERRLAELHSEFLKIDEKLKVTAMDIVSIAEQLVAEGVCETLRSARTTASYALEWMSGTSNIDFSKSQVKGHAAKLNRIGINIRNACDTSRFAPVFVRQGREVTKSALVVPMWYQRPNHLQQVAA